jgi:hypothetical protein
VLNLCGRGSDCTLAAQGAGREGARSTSTSMTPLILKRALASLAFGEWHGEDYDVLADGVVVGRVFTSLVAPKDAPWFWSLGHAHVSNRRPTSGTAATLEAAMAAFAKSWRRG